MQKKELKVLLEKLAKKEKISFRRLKKNLLK
jgi:hypothetical protein